MKTLTLIALYRRLSVLALCCAAGLYSFNGYAQLSCGSTVSTYPYSESFESGLGGWTQSAADDFDWTYNSGGTPTANTGPSSAQDGSWYYYLEATNDNNSAAALLSPCFDLTYVTNAQLTFYYHMYGADIRDIRINASSDGSSWTQLFFVNNDQGNAWHQGVIDLSAYDGGMVQIEVVGQTKKKDAGDIAIDHFMLTGNVLSNDPPNAVNDNASTPNDPIIIDVLANDSDPNGDIITLTAITTAPGNGGTATINDNGTPGYPIDDYVDYTPSGSFFGVETFQYQICDNGLPSSACDIATVSVTVSPNTAPNAVADAGSTTADQTLNIDVLGNDSDADGHTLTITNVTTPLFGGTTSIHNNGTPGNPADDYVVFVPNGLYVGIATFNYTICDNGNPNQCSNATVTVTILPNTPPNAVNDNATTINEPISISVLANDSDPDGHTITLTSITSSPNHGGMATINDNGTPGNPADDFINYIPSGVYFGVETFVYQICDDGAPTACATATVSVTVNPNTAPDAIDDNASVSNTGSVNVYVLGNDSDVDGHSITLTSITTAPNHGGTAVINNNGTPGNPNDDYIVFTPEGSYLGNETFTYQICDDGTPNLCATATVTITISTCPDGSTPEASPNFAWGSEWKYEDTGADLGTTWKERVYTDDLCWAWGDGELGFGDGDETTVINNHGGFTYYFRKHFNVADAAAVNNLFIEMKRDDGAVVYLNGTEIYRTNMPAGPVTYTSQAPANQSGAAESAVHSVVAPASLLVDGDNVIAVEVHQDLASSSDITFDMQMTADMVDHSGGVLIAEGSNWNFNDNGVSLGTSWASASIQETKNEWDAGPGELGYGDGDEVTVLDYGPDANNKYPTYYFRHYFQVYDFNNYDSLWIKLRKDDGAVVYINGVEVYREGMPTGTIDYTTYANFTAAGTDESDFYTKSYPAAILNNGMNVVAVEIHQVNATSSDISFDMQLELYDGDPSNYTPTFDLISGRVYLDTDVSRSYTSADYGQGAIEVWAYQDLNEDGNIDLDTDPRLFSYLSDPGGHYQVEVYNPGVTSVKSDVASSADDAYEDGTNKVTLADPVLASYQQRQAPTLIFDSLSTWRYYDLGGISDTTWRELGYNDGAWGSGIGDLGFGDPVNTTLTSGEITYYFRKTVSLPAQAANWNTAKMFLMRDDGAVVYINGKEVFRTNMPEGPITPTTQAPLTIEGADEGKYLKINIPNPGFVSGNNIIAVEVHQRGATSSDVQFDMMLFGEISDYNDVAYRFKGINVPQGAKIVDAHIRMHTASTTEKIAAIEIHGENTDNSAPFVATNGNISSRARTSEMKVWNNEHPFVDEREYQMNGLKKVVQEIVDRPGWSPGNAMSFFLTGYEVEFYTFDGGFGPELTISYVDTTQTEVHYVMGIDATDMPEYFNYLTDGTPSATISAGGRGVSNLDIGYIGVTSMCLATSDDNFDGLHIINRFSGKNKFIGATGTAMEIEAIALSAGADTLYAVDANEFGTINMNTGVFTGYGNTIGTANGSAGSINLSDVDGLAFDLTRGVMWATQRRTGGAFDLIFIINTSTGQFVPDAFGAGVDYVVLSGAGVLPDLDDIAVNPNTGNLFAMNNDNGGITNLIEIDVSNGVVTTIDSTGLDDMEGQGFHNDGRFYSTSGREGIPDNSFYLVDTATVSLTLIGFFESEGDFEGCDCKSGPAVNFVDGTVYHDVNENGILDPGETGLANVNIYVYADTNNNGNVNRADPIIATTVTDATGYFAVGIFQRGNFLIFADTLDLPPLSTFTTPDKQDARFAVNGGIDFGNDFGFRNGDPLPVELLTFTGERMGPANHLSWTTVSEINSDFFSIQRSEDGAHFEEIGRKRGAGNTTEMKTYSFKDAAPVKGSNYYRLQQYDFDGTYSYSRIIELKQEGTPHLTTEISPNPTDGPVRIALYGQLESEEAMNVRVYNMAGTVIEEHTMKPGQTAIDLQLKGLQKGVYLIEMWNSTYQISEKVILR